MTAAYLVPVFNRHIYTTIYLLGFATKIFKKYARAHAQKWPKGFRLPRSLSVKAWAIEILCFTAYLFLSLCVFPLLKSDASVSLNDSVHTDTPRRTSHRIE